MGEMQAEPLYNINICRAKLITEDVVDCLAVEQVHFCPHAFSFGYSYFCRHPQKMEFIEKTKQQPHPDKSNA